MSTFELDELAEAIEAGQTPSDSAAASLDEIGGAALGELLRRLKDPESAKELAGTGLLNLCLAYVKDQAKKLERDANKPDRANDMDEIDLILTSTLSADHKSEQLRVALERLDKRRRRILNLLEGGLEPDE